MSKSSDPIRPNGLLDQVDDAIIGLDPDGSVIDWSPAAVEMFGWTREQVLGKELAAFLVPERLRKDHRAALHQYAKTGKLKEPGKERELPSLTSNGKEILVCYRPIVVHVGNTYRFYATARKR